MPNINKGIIGTGEFAKKYYFPAFAKHNNVKIAAVANRTPQKGYQIAEKYGIEQVFTGESGWEKIIESNSIHAIAICTPNNLHAEIAIAAAKEGKHILVEKPIAISSAEAKQMIQAAKENNVILMTAFPQRFMPAFQEAKKILNSGYLGKIKKIEFTFGHSGPENWSSQGNWYFDKKQSGGGVLIDLASHQIDTVLWLVEKSITEVFSTRSTLEKDIEVEDNATLEIKFEDEEFAVLHSSWTLKPNPANDLLVQCEKGTLEIKNNTLKVATNSKPSTYHDLPSIGHLAKKIAMDTLLAHFIESIVNNRKPLITGVDGLRSLEVVLAAYQSATNGNLVKFL